MEEITYTPTLWINDETLVNATHMNNIEFGISSCVTAINEIITTYQIKLIAGDNITIDEDGTISANGGLTQTEVQEMINAAITGSINNAY